VAHDRNAALYEIGDGGGHGGAALDLHGLTARLLHDPHGVGVGLFRRALVRAERHVDHDHRAFGAAHHRLAMQDHHLHGHAHGVGQAVDDHAQRVADQQHVAGRVQRGGDGRRVGGQADDGLAALARGDVGSRQATDLLFTMGGQDRHSSEKRVPFSARTFGAAT
jgi:hypothetical protein